MQLRPALVKVRLVKVSSAVVQGRRVWSIINININNNINIGININIKTGLIFGLIVVVVVVVNLNHAGGGVCVDSSPGHH